MVKTILINYVMGRYRKTIMVFLTIISLFLLIRWILISKTLNFNEDALYLIISYIAFVVSIYNGSPIGYPEVNSDSNSFDIFMRIFLLVITLVIFIYFADKLY